MAKETAAIKIQCFFKGRLCRKQYQAMLAAHKHKLKMKEFPYDFNEQDFVIPNFSRFSKLPLRRRTSSSMNHRSSSETTEASGHSLSDKNMRNSSEGNISDSCSESNKFSPGKFKIIGEHRDYKPLLNEEEAKRARTKQKVYVKYAHKQKKRKDSLESASSESKIIVIHHYRL